MRGTPFHKAVWVLAARHADAGGPVAGVTS